MSDDNGTNNTWIWHCSQSSNKLVDYNELIWPLIAWKRSIGQVLQSSDSVLDLHCQTDPPGLSLHTLQVKVNSIYHLIRKFSVNHGLVKNARVIMKELRNQLLPYDSSTNKETPYMQTMMMFSLPRISFTHVLPSGTLLRRQISIDSWLCNDIQQLSGS